jgi:7,8-dihydropterin-6-yl-methyl-4-(beta-D-ribofuranosyl)aminobenzene 5'-phosphate synthase
MITIQIIYDNTSSHKSLIADWGFAALIKTGDRIILFDTGANGEILLKNMEVLGIIPTIISDVFISHCHFDHIGGLGHFLNENNRVTIHAPISFRGVRQAKEIRYYDKPEEIYPGFITSGELEGIEQALAIKTDKGLVIIAGCSHPAVKNTLDIFRQYGDIYGILGGLHGFNQFELFRDMQLICPTHCTQYKEKIKKLYPKKYIEGGAGKLIQI